MFLAIFLENIKSHSPVEHSTFSRVNQMVFYGRERCDCDSYNSKFVIKERFEKLTSVIFYFQYRLMIRAKFIGRRKLSDCSNDSPFHVFIELS